MRRKNKKQNMLLVLLLLVASVSMGYAMLNTTLNIDGTSKIKDAKWNIYWENPQIVTGSTITSLPTIDSAKTTASFNVTLNNPGDYYEFTIDAKNAGTIDAMISEIHYKLNNAEISETNKLPAYINYTVTKSDDTALEVNQRLNANSKETYKVKVEFKKDITVNQLPGSEVELQLDFSVVYVQAEGTDSGSGNNGGDNDTSDDPNAVMNLAITNQLKVGDVVNYDPGTHSITFTAAETGLAEIPASGSYSSYSNLSQTIGTKNSEMLWRVFSIDNTTGTVKLVGLTAYDDDNNNIVLYGKAGFANSVNILNQIGAMFGQGYGAKSGRSMTLFDLGDAIGYNYRPEFSAGGSYTFTKGEVFTQNGSEFSSSTVTASTENPVSLTGAEEMWFWGDLDDKIESSTGEQKAYYETINDMIFGDYSKEYKLANQYVSVDTYSAVGTQATYCIPITLGSYYEEDPGWLYQSRIQNGTPGNSSSIAYDPALPLVELKKSAKLEKVNNVWNFVNE